MENAKRDLAVKISKIVILISSLVGLAAIIFDYGFETSDEFSESIRIITIVVVIIFILYNAFAFFIAPSKKNYFKSHKIESLLILFILIELISFLFGYSIVQNIGLFFHLKDAAFLYIVIAQLVIVIGFFVGGLRYNKLILKSKIHPARLFVGSFFITILIGALFLSLPRSTVSGDISFIDALFTSTSAVCVTGLITLDTATYFTKFGQLVILILFQIGGLGLMTFTTFFALFLAGGLGLKEKILINDLLGEDNVGAIAKLVSYLVIITITIELIGAGILYYSLTDIFPNRGDAAFMAIFHSVSSFCNAGFSLFTLNIYDPLVRSDYLFTTAISILIIIGGLGFPTIINIVRSQGFAKIKKDLTFKTSLQSKIVIFITLALLLFGAVFTYLLEYNHSLNQLSEAGKIHAAYFQSVTARTAGFNTVDVSQFSTPTSFLYIFLMFIGASPGGTGGGIKTTTFAIILISLWSYLRNKNKANIYKRSLSPELITRAMLKTLLSIFIILLGVFFLTMVEQKNLLDILFEAFSAFGTVGLSRGITGDLSDAGKIIIILLMFIGRVGPLTFIYNFFSGGEQPRYDYPSEDISTV